MDVERLQNPGEPLHEQASVLDCGDKRSEVTALASEPGSSRSDRPARLARSKAATTPPPLSPQSKTSRQSHGSP